MEEVGTTRVEEGLSRMLRLFATQPRDSGVKI